MASRCYRPLLSGAHSRYDASVAKSVLVRGWDSATKRSNFRRCRSATASWKHFRSFSSGITSNEEQQKDSVTLDGAVGHSCSDDTTSLSSLPEPDCSSKIDLSSSITDLSSYFWNSTTHNPSLLATQAHRSVEELQWYNINAYVMDLVHFTHDVTGLSYASSIMAITVGIRLFVILPFGIIGLRSDPTVERDVEKMKQRIETTNNAAERSALMDQVTELNRRAKRQRRLRIGTPIASLATFLLMWSGLRYMAVYYPQDLVNGGMLWFPDLTERDPILFLPTLSSITFYLMGEINADELGKPTRSFGPFWRTFWRCVRAGSFVFFWNAPAAIFCYWLPNSTISLAQAMILSQPPVRRALGIVPKEERMKANKAGAIEFVDSTKVRQADSSNNPQISLPRKKTRLSKRKK